MHDIKSDVFFNFCNIYHYFYVILTIKIFDISNLALKKIQ
jgi:hypothetical protein